jgi:hypothetical protein
MRRRAMARRPGAGHVGPRATGQPAPVALPGGGHRSAATDPAATEQDRHRRQPRHPSPMGDTDCYEAARREWVRVLGVRRGIVVLMDSSTAESAGRRGRGGDRVRCGAPPRDRRASRRTDRDRCITGRCVGLQRRRPPWGRDHGAATLSRPDGRTSPTRPAARRRAGDEDRERGRRSGAARRASGARGDGDESMGGPLARRRPSSLLREDAAPRTESRSPP